MRLASLDTSWCGVFCTAAAGTMCSLRFAPTPCASSQAFNGGQKCCSSPRSARRSHDIGSQQPRLLTLLSEARPLRDAAWCHCARSCLLKDSGKIRDNLQRSHKRGNRSVAELPARQSCLSTAFGAPRTVAISCTRVCISVSEPVQQLVNDSQAQVWCLNNANLSQSRKSIQ